MSALHRQELALASQKLLSMQQAAALTPYSAEYLSLLARKGRLPAIKINRDWVTTQDAVLEYLERQRKKHAKIVKQLDLSLEAQTGLVSLKACLIVALMLFSGCVALSGTIHILGSFWAKPKTIVISNVQPKTEAKINESALLTLSKGFKDALSPGAQVLGDSIKLNEPAAPGKVLGESITYQPPAESLSLSDIQGIVESIFNSYIAQGKFQGNFSANAPTGASGMVQNGNGNSTAVVGNTPIVSYYPPSQSQNFTGGSVLGAGQLSGSNFSANNASVSQNLTVQGNTTLNGSVNLATTTISALTVTGSSTSTVGTILPATGGTLTQNVTTNIWTPTLANDIYNDNSKWIAVGADGFVRAVVTDNGVTVLKFIRCTDTACTSPVVTTLASGGPSFFVDEPWMVMGSDGLPRISYINYNRPDELHFIKCADANCATTTPAYLDKLIDKEASGAGAGDAYYTLSMALTSADVPSFVYDDYSDRLAGDALQFAHCSDSSCTTVATSTLDNESTNVEAPSIIMDNNNLPMIVYPKGSTRIITYLHCTDAACTSPTTKNIASYNGNSGYYTAIAKSPIDGFARIAYTDDTGLHYVVCNDILCSAPTVTSLDSSSFAVAAQVSIALASDGTARVSYDSNGFGVKYIQCSNDTCSAKSTAVIASVGGYPMSFALGNDGFGRIVYPGANNTPLKLTRLLNDSGITAIAGSSLGTSANPYGQIFGTRVTAQELWSQGSSLNALQVQNSAGAQIFNVDSQNGTINITGATNITGTSTITGDVVITGDATIGVTRTHTVTTGLLGPNFGDFANLGHIPWTNANNNAYLLEIDILDGANTGAKKFVIPVGYGDDDRSTPSSWQEVLPLFNTGLWTHCDYALDINTNHDTPPISFRVRRAHGDGDPQCVYNIVATIKVYGNDNFNYFNYNFVADSATGTGATIDGLYRETPLTQIQGKVGIGTTSPTSSLYIQGSTANSSASSLNVVNSNSASLLFVRNDGNIGMGSTSPPSQLTVDNSSTSPTATLVLFNNLSTNIAASAVAGAIIQSMDNDSPTLMIRNATTTNCVGQSLGCSGAAPAGGLGILTIQGNDNTATTSYNLISAFNKNVTGGSSTPAVFRVRADGNVYGEAAFNASGADYAEYFYTPDQSLTAGDVVVAGLGIRMPNSAVKPRVAYDNHLLGVISTNPAFIGNNPGGENDNQADQKLVALVGRVPVKVSLENGSIHEGDYLTSSPTKPGYAMKAIRSGNILGMALGDYDGSEAPADISQPDGNASTSPLALSPTPSAPTVLAFIHPGYQMINNTFVLGENDGQLATATGTQQIANSSQ